MIRTLKGKIALALAEGRRPKGFPPDLVRSAQNKLAVLDAAATLADLRSPPGNRLHALTDDRKGQHAISSTISGGFAFAGRRMGQRMWRFATITRAAGDKSATRFFAEPPRPLKY